MTVLTPAVPLLVPVQVPPKVLLASTRAPGSVSTRSALKVATVALALASVMVSTLVPPVAMVVGAKALATVGATTTVLVKVQAMALPAAVAAASSRTE